MENNDHVEIDDYMHRISTYMQYYEQMDSGTKYMWEAKRRDHLAQQLYMKDLIVKSIFQKPQQSGRSIEGEINSWCIHMTIERFVKSCDSFGYYKEFIFPKLSPNQQKKHLEFSKIVYERKWDLLGGNGNFLDESNVIILITYDKKWFWGIILRDYAKHFEYLGIDKYGFKTFHRLYMNRFMGIGFVAAHFYDTLENSCVVKKFPFIRAQERKKAKRDVRESRVLPDGSRKYDGGIVQYKYDIYWVDCLLQGQVMEHRVTQNVH